MKLKTNVLFLLFTILGSYHVNAVRRCIQCVGCPEEFSPGTNGTTCAAGSDTCMKQTIRFMGGVMISKGCVPASTCKESSINVAGVGFWLNCCTNADNCNTSNKTIALNYLYLISFILSLFLNI